MASLMIMNPKKKSTSGGKKTVATKRKRRRTSTSSRTTHRRTYRRNPKFGSFNIDRGFIEDILGIAVGIFGTKWISTTLISKVETLKDYKVVVDLAVAFALSKLLPGNRMLGMGAFVGALLDGFKLLAPNAHATYFAGMNDIDVRNALMDGLGEGAYQYLDPNQMQYVDPSQLTYENVAEPVYMQGLGDVNLTANN